VKAGKLPVWVVSPRVRYVVWSEISAVVEAEAAQHQARRDGKGATMGEPRDPHPGA